MENRQVAYTVEYCVGDHRKISVEDYLSKFPNGMEQFLDQSRITIRNLEYAVNDRKLPCWSVCHDCGEGVRLGASKIQDSKDLWRATRCLVCNSENIVDVDGLAATALSIIRMAT